MPPFTSPDDFDHTYFQVRPPFTQSVSAIKRGLPGREALPRPPAITADAIRRERAKFELVRVHPIRSRTT